MNYIDPLYDWEAEKVEAVYPKPFQQSGEVLAPAVETLSPEEERERIWKLVVESSRG